MARERPNFLTDQHRCDSLGVNGNAICRTPNMDALAGSGVNFTNAYTCSAVCTPARASIYTGLLPHSIPGTTSERN